MSAEYKELTIYRPKFSSFDLMGGVAYSTWGVLLSHVEEPEMEIGSSASGVAAARITLPFDFEISIPPGDEERLMVQFEADEIRTEGHPRYKKIWLREAAGVILKASGAEAPLAPVIPFPNRG